VEDHKLNRLFHIYCLSCFIVFFQVFCSNARVCAQSWADIDKQLYKSIFQINVGIDVRLKDGSWIQVSGLSPRRHYYVFTTVSHYQGYQVVGHGSCFPVATANKQKIFFVTSKHVLDNAAETIEECEMFYAAVQLYASKTAGKAGVATRLKNVLQAINLSLKKNLTAAEKKLYAEMVDAIWDCYDTNLSTQADPGRLLYNKYKKLNCVQAKVAYLVHSPGSIEQQAIETKIYKVSIDSNPDIAILTETMPVKRPIKTLDLDLKIPSAGQQIQVVGYPYVGQPVNSESVKYYAPTFANGKITGVATNTFEFDAQISKGNSGGPVIGDKGKVLGVVTLKELVENKKPSYGVAIGARSIKMLAPELFQKQ
jgi:hypothetical protein